MKFWRRLLTLAYPPRLPDPSPADRAIAAAFVAWAHDRGLEVCHREKGLRVAGTVAGRSVVVDPGIDGPVPGWVQVTIAVAFPAAKPLLVTRATAAHDAATAAVRALFDAPDLGPELRAISVSLRHLRLRLAPGASPIVVESAVRAVGETMRTLHGVGTDSTPRHPCSTTVPYPT